MDDDDEIQSHPSPASGSPASSPRENGRITVTVAAPAPQAQAPSNSLTLALPVQPQPRGNNGGGGGGREDCWSEGATAVLIDAWGERYLELSRGNLKQKHWKEVAEIVSGREDYTKAPKTDIQCKNRIDTVKKKYKSEKAKIAAGSSAAASKWQFFERLDQLIGPTAKIPGVSGTSAAGNSNLQLHKVPLGIPVGIRGGGTNQFNPHKQQNQPQTQSKNQKIQFRRRPPPADSDSSEREVSSPVSSDSFPPESYERKRPRLMNSSSVKGRDGGVRKGKGWGSAVRELTQAILKFGEAYEQAESSKLQQVVEMEKQRMKFAKDLELQRMQFFMKTQLEISQLKLGRKGGNGNASNHHSNNNNNKHNNNSDSE